MQENDRRLCRPAENKIKEIFNGCVEINVDGAQLRIMLTNLKVSPVWQKVSPQDNIFICELRLQQHRSSSLVLLASSTEGSHSSFRILTWGDVYVDKVITEIKGDLYDSPIDSKNQIVMSTLYNNDQYQSYPLCPIEAALLSMSSHTYSLGEE
uniref:Uncharacterized protein n=1 Tax=Oryza meridionalis TaxID=40149 RepID=A0A0E0C197_9ORYZ